MDEQELTPELKTTTLVWELLDLIIEEEIEQAEALYIDDAIQIAIDKLKKEEQS